MATTVQRWEVCRTWDVLVKKGGVIASGVASGRQFCSHPKAIPALVRVLSGSMPMTHYAMENYTGLLQDCALMDGNLCQ